MLLNQHHTEEHILAIGLVLVVSAVYLPQSNDVEPLIICEMIKC